MTTKKEKKREARRILKKNGYSDREIKKILRYAFDDKKKETIKVNNKIKVNDEKEEDIIY